MEQNETQAPATKEYPKPTYEQLETKLGFVARKSNRRRAALRQIADAHLLLKYRYTAMTNDYNVLVDEYNALQQEVNELETELEAKEAKPWYRFGF